MSDEPIPLDRGVAGRSARLEWERRHERRENEIRSRFGRLGGAVLALTSDPQSVEAWADGAAGERALGALLDSLRDEGMAVLHDRRVPRTRANIDHLVISPAGVFVIDAKNYSGRVERRDRGGLLSADYRLYVGGRDRSALLEGAKKQVAVVRAALPSDEAVPVTPVICFVSADWALFARPLVFGEVQVLWPRALGKLLRSESRISADAISGLERQLGLALPPA